LILVPAFLGWQDQGLGFDIAEHFGSLLAVYSDFRADIAAMCGSILDASNPHARLAWQIVAATVPLGIAQAVALIPGTSRSGATITAVLWGSLTLVGAVSGIVAFATIAVFFKLIDRIGMVLLALYRFVLGAVILYAFA
jgi:undecaprenyl pyrophosphate phosphatase UppP